MKKLFVSGFPLEVTEMELATLVAPYGDIDTIKIVRDKKTRKCKGYAFVEMKNSEGARNAAAELDGREMNGRHLTVNVNPDTQEAPPEVVPQTFKRITTAPAEEVRISQRIDRISIEKPKRSRRTRI